MPEVVLGVGSNIKREANIESGLRSLAEALDQLALSRVYRGAAVGFCGDDFYNLVVHARTQLPLGELSALLKAIELQHGKLPSAKKYAPRTLDIDILTYADLVGNFAGIVLPRADILTQAYVLRPLAELLPDARHPITQRSYAQHWQAFDPAGQALSEVNFLQIEFL